MFAQPPGVKPFGHGDALRVIGDGDILVAEFLCRFNHFGDCRAPVGRCGVHVQVAAHLL